MKKIFLSFLIIMSTIILAACNKFTCSNCKKEVDGTKHVYKTASGESYDICNECHKTLSPLLEKSDN